jgi:hypothetical protein
LCGDFSHTSPVGCHPIGMTSTDSFNSAVGSGSAVHGSPLILLRLEGLAVAALTFVVYAHIGASWWLFVALWIAPDLSMVGYFHSPCWGARLYNIAHTYVVPSILTLFALLFGVKSQLPIALIWINHIGIDRLLGYGLKYSNGFGWTHLGRLGKEKVSQD